ncbi:hypothetical protein BH10CYA1_BH10CYA1_64160 [soil metagenome]
MNKLLFSIILVASLSNATYAQGLISAPDESQRPLVNRLELERAKLFHQGLKDVKSKTVYGSIVWQLADKYESLNQWQEALAAYNTLRDLKLPPNAMSECADCQMRATDDVLSLDSRRLESKVSSVESFKHIRLDHKKRLPVPIWGAKEKNAYALAVKNVTLPSGHAVTLKQTIKP